MITALNVDKLRLDMGEYVLSVQSLRKRIGVRDILCGVDVDVKRGTFAALVGPKGAGKSVTLACIAGALKPTRGRIRYFGYEIKGRPEPRVVRMGVARTHQAAQLFAGLTALESVTVGALLRRPRLARAQAHAREILQIAGLEGRAASRVDALDELDRRRLEIARAVSTDPQLLLLDDPWTGLDAEQTTHLTALCAAIRARGTTILAATRTLQPLSSLADTVVEIDRGTTAGTGLHAALDLQLKR
jgi:branched-chain amino acid transport system ATP-binding protein